MTPVLSEAEEQRRRELYERGLKDPEIADRVGVARTTIVGWRKKRGLPPNAPSGGQPRPVKERFWEKVDKGSPDECWEWTGATNHGGYGRLSHEGEPMNAHRIAWMLHHGESPGDSFVCHTCDNPPCVNPDHLWLGDHQANMTDAKRKGRMDTTSRPGDAIGTSVLTEDEVREIRRLYGSTDITQVELAERYGVTQTCVSSILRRETWDHI